VPYSHDVFISYRRDRFRDEWLIDHFIPIFKSFVKEAITAEADRDPDTIFFDQTELDDSIRAFDPLDLKGIEPGQNWKNALEQAIKTSRCVVTLWSPQYFRSKWCNIEWRSFRERGILLNLDLVVPVTVFDGEKFPADAQAPQLASLNDYVIPGEGFKSTTEYPEFIKRVRKLAIRVGKVVASAPPFAAWPISAWQAPSTDPEVKQPLL
jgi:TIR domain-containing protein